MEDLVDFLDFVDYAEVEAEAANNRLPKTYLRDIENPMEFFNGEQFQQRYRFKKEQVRDILQPIIQRHMNNNHLNNRGLPVPNILALLITLRFYATGSFQNIHGDLRGFSQPTVSRVIKKVSVAFSERLQEYIKFPQTDDRKRADMYLFYQMEQFPSVSGCIDCTHIPIKNPGTDVAEVYRNRKHYFSINVQVVAGPRMEIMDIVVRHPGSSHDNTIFERSYVRHRLEQGHIMGLFLGDNGYSCRPYLLTPVLNPGNDAERQYNRSHIVTRNIVERLFGVWKRRFACLHTELRTKLETSVAIICATAVLHNIAVELNVPEPAVEVDVLYEDVHNDNANNNLLGLEFRREFIRAHF